MAGSVEGPLAPAETRVMPADGAQLAEPASPPTQGEGERWGASGGQSQEGATAEGGSEEELERRKAELLGVREQWRQRMRILEGSGAALREAGPEGGRTPEGCSQGLYEDKVRALLGTLQCQAGEARRAQGELLELQRARNAAEERLGRLEAALQGRLRGSGQAPSRSQGKLLHATRELHSQFCMLHARLDALEKLSATREDLAVQGMLQRSPLRPLS